MAQKHLRMLRAFGVLAISILPVACGDVSVVKIEETGVGYVATESDALKAAKIALGKDALSCGPYSITKAGANWSVRCESSSKQRINVLIGVKNGRAVVLAGRRPGGTADVAFRASIAK